MSKADVECPHCEHSFVFRGLSCESCFCPSCNRQIRLNSPNARVIEAYGLGDDPRKV